MKCSFEGVLSPSYCPYDSRYSRDSGTAKGMKARAWRGTEIEVYEFLVIYSIIRNAFVLKSKPIYS